MFKNIPSCLLTNPSGNYKEALNNDMKLIVDELKDNFEKDELFIIEGGAVKEAKYGLKF